jgi:hypothetical protein
MCVVSLNGIPRVMCCERLVLVVGIVCVSKALLGFFTQHYLYMMAERYIFTDFMMWDSLAVDFPGTSWLSETSCDNSYYSSHLCDKYASSM